MLFELLILCIFLPFVIIDSVVECFKKDRETKVKTTNYKVLRAAVDISFCLMWATGLSVFGISLYHSKCSITYYREELYNTQATNPWETGQAMMKIDIKVLIARNGNEYTGGTKIYQNVADEADALREYYGIGTDLQCKMYWSRLREIDAISRQHYDANNTAIAYEYVGVEDNGSKRNDVNFFVFMFSASLFIFSCVLLIIHTMEDQPKVGVPSSSTKKYEEPKKENV